MIALKDTPRREPEVSAFFARFLVWLLLVPSLSTAQGGLIGDKRIRDHLEAMQRSEGDMWNVSQADGQYLAALVTQLDAKQVLWGKPGQPQLGRETGTGNRDSLN